LLERRAVLIAGGRGRSETGVSLGIRHWRMTVMDDYFRTKRRGVRLLSTPQKTEWEEWLYQFADRDGDGFDLNQ
jgi:hypothetical protein